MFQRLHYSEPFETTHVLPLLQSACHAGGSLEQSPTHFDGQSTDCVGTTDFGVFQHFPALSQCFQADCSFVSVAFLDQQRPSAPASSTAQTAGYESGSSRIHRQSLGSIQARTHLHLLRESLFAQVRTQDPHPDAHGIQTAEMSRVFQAVWRSEQPQQTYPTACRTYGRNRRHTIQVIWSKLDLKNAIIKLIASVFIYRLFRCELCGKVLVRRRDLDRHIQSRHSSGSSSQHEPSSVDSIDCASPLSSADSSHSSSSNSGRDESDDDHLDVVDIC